MSHFFSTEEGKIYLQYEEVFKARVMSRMYHTDHKSESYARECSYLKGMLDALNNFSAERSRMIEELKKNNKD